MVIVADDTLYIVDLKYGKGIAVSAEWNPQMLLYSLGALELFGSLYDIEKVNMTIHQPRLENVSTFEITVHDLMEWAEQELMPKAEMAAKGEGEFAVGDWCRFCKAKNTCRARAEEYLGLPTKSEQTDLLQALYGRNGETLLSRRRYRSMMAVSKESRGSSRRG